MGHPERVPAPLALVALLSALALTAPSAEARTASVPTTATTTTVTTTLTGSAAVGSDPGISLQGRGFGHGRGMSQWGARGAAGQGRTGSQILAFYYPGTTVGAIGNPTLRVRLSAMTNQPTTVRAEAGLTVSDGSCTAALTRAGTTWWRVLRSNGQWLLQGYWTNSAGTAGWWSHPTACTGFASAAGLVFVGDGSLAASALTLRTPAGDRDYAGGLRATIDNRPGAGQVTTVNHVAMDRYLQSVVPAEMPASWPVEALKAQAVAARSYGAAALGKSYSSDICDTTSCQVYPGLTTAHPPTSASNAAVAATSGQVLRYGTAVALTEFGSTNGGQVAGSTLAYQVAKADPYDGLSPGAPTAWQGVTLAASTLQSRWPAIGTFRSLAVTRDGKGGWFGGRPTRVTLTGSLGSTSVAAETFRATLGLRSTYFTTVGSLPGTDLAGNGLSDLVARDGAGTLWNYPGNGRAGWLPRTAIATGWPASREIIAPGDFSGDGIPDLVSRSTTGDLTLHQGDGVGRLASSSLIGKGWQGFSSVLAPGDLDGDGTSDLLAREPGGALWLYPSTGVGTFRPRVGKGGGWQVYQELQVLGDLDSDGGTDLVGTTSAGALHLLRFSAKGAFLGARQVGSGWTGYSGLAGMGDVDGDRRVDLLARDSSGRLWAYLGNGAGAFTSRVQVGAGWLGLTYGS